MCAKSSIDLILKGQSVSPIFGVADSSSELAVSPKLFETTKSCWIDAVE